MFVVSRFINYLSAYKSLYINFCLFYFAFLLFPSTGIACLSLTVGKKATSLGVPIISRTSDSKDARRAKNLKIYTANMDQKLYIGLPYWDLVFDPSYDMSQVATNRFGVSISATQTIQSNRMVLTLDAPSGTGQGISEPNIPAIVMPQATSAKEGIILLGKAIEERGVNDGWGFGVQIADSNEIWYLETLSGHQWVAIRIPDDVYFVAANGPGQIQEYLPEKYTYLMSNYQNITPIKFASQYGIANYQNGIFNFRGTFADIQKVNNRNSNFIRIAYVQHLLNPSTKEFNQSVLNESSYPMFLKPESLVTVEDIKKIQMSHYEDYPEFDPYHWSYQDENTHSFYYPISNLRTSNAHITQIFSPLNNNDVSISNVQYIALGMPSLSFYLPIYYGIEKVPTRLSGGTDKADDHTLFWQFRKIQALVFLNDSNKQIPYEFEQRQAYVTLQYQALEQLIQEKQKTLESTYRESHDLSLINQFTQDAVDALSLVNEKIIQHFLTELDIDALYGFNNSLERNNWFTRIVREQDCYYRRYHCDASPYLLKTRMEKYSDGI